jgi:hypothetical protein
MGSISLEVFTILHTTCTIERSDGVGTVGSTMTIVFPSHTFVNVFTEGSISFVSFVTFTSVGPLCDVASCVGMTTVVVWCAVVEINNVVIEAWINLQFGGRSIDDSSVVEGLPDHVLSSVHLVHAGIHHNIEVGDH